MLADMLKKLKAYAAAQEEILDHIIRGYALLNEGATNTLVAQKFDDTYGAHGFNLIIYQLILSVIKDCHEIVFSKQKGSPSLFYTRKALLDADVHQHLLESFSEPLVAHWASAPVSEEIKLQALNQRRIERAADFGMIFERFMESFKQAETSDLFLRAGNIRNKIVSHFELKMVDDIHKMTTIEVYGILWDEVEVLVKRVESLVSDAITLITKSTIDTSWYGAEQVAKDFWNRVVE